MNEQLQREIIYQQTMNTQALITALGMLSDNMDSQTRGETMRWSKSDFDKVIDEFGIHHNSVLTRLQSTY